MAVVNRVPELVQAKYGAGVSLTEVQRATGLNYATVSSWMKRTVSRVDFPTLEIWCRYLDAEIGDLLQYQPDGEGNYQ
jgi:DNA-binding Xre family transcriptional regulator